jgi:hypothetical protein
MIAPRRQGVCDTGLDRYSPRSTKERSRHVRLTHADHAARSARHGECLSRGQDRPVVFPDRREGRGFHRQRKLIGRGENHFGELPARAGRFDGLWLYPTRSAQSAAHHRHLANPWKMSPGSLSGGSVLTWRERVGIESLKAQFASWRVAEPHCDSCVSDALDAVIGRGSEELSLTHCSELFRVSKHACRKATPLSQHRTQANARRTTLWRTRAAPQRHPMA